MTWARELAGQQATPERNAPAERGIGELKREALVRRWPARTPLLNALVRLVAALERLDHARLRCTRGWTSAAQADLDLPHWRLKTTRGRFFATARCEIRKAVLDWGFRRALIQGSCSSLDPGRRPRSGKTTDPRAIEGVQIVQLMRTCAVSLAGALLVGPAAGQYTQWVDKTNNGLAPNGGALLPEVAGAGSIVAFLSIADNLVPNDGNGERDVFVCELSTGGIELISIGISGNAAGASSHPHSLSLDGRYVAFASFSHDIVQGVANNARQVYVRDRLLGTTVRISQTGIGNPASNDSYWPRLSADGRYVAFYTGAPELSMSTNTSIVIADRDSDGDGDFDELVSPPIAAVLAPQSLLSSGSDFFLSGSGQFLLHTRFSGMALEIYLADRDTDGDGVFDEQVPAPLQLVASVASAGQGLNPQGLSDDGRYSLYTLGQPGSGQLFAFDRVALSTTLIGLGGQEAALSANGRFVVYPDDDPLSQAYFTTLVDRDVDGNGVFDEPGLVHKHVVGLSSSGKVKTGWPGRPEISDDGQVIAFESTLSALVPDAPTNGLHIYVHQTGLGPYLAPYCAATPSSTGCSATLDWSGYASVSDSAPFMITAAGVIGQKVGLLFYGFGQTSIPFLGGTLCVQPPLRRTALQFSGGSSPTNCSGSFAFDMNQQIQGGGDPFLVFGQATYAQYLYRDPGAAIGTALSNGLQFTVLP